MLLAIDAICLPIKRPFRWRAVWILGVLFIVGKLANIPLLLVSRPSVEPLSTWVIGGSLGFVVIGISLYLAGRIGIGLPLLEGLLTEEKISQVSNPRTVRLPDAQRSRLWYTTGANEVR